MRPHALRAMVEFLDRTATTTGDPARIHSEALATRAALEGAREEIALWLSVRPRQVVFTSGATESIAAACFGARNRTPDAQHMVCATVEHSAVRSWCRRGPCSEIGVDSGGRVDIGELVAATGDDTTMVHLQWANHEVGTRQPVAEAADALSGHSALLHVDAAQAGAEAPDAIAAGADVVSISGHKLGGPPGAGLLVVRKGLRLAPLLVGGDQERARRAGMENVPAALGLAAVAETLHKDGRHEIQRLEALSDRIRTWAIDADGVELVGDPTHRVAHLVCVVLRDVEPQPVLLGLDQRGVSVHSGSSCSSEAFDASPVLAAMGLDADHSLRLSVGWSSTDADVDLALAALDATLEDLRHLGRGTR